MLFLMNTRSVALQ